jgi:serine phosphatase RsbU (regulator of sigma subunit)
MTNKGIALLFSVFILCGFQNSGFASDTLKIVTDHQDYSVDQKYIQVLEDKTRKLTFKEILSSDSLFIDCPATLTHTENFNSAYWLKFHLKNKSSNSHKWVIEIFDPHINYLELYMPDEQGKYVLHKAGNYEPYEIREYHHKNFVFDIDIPTNSNETKVFYVRMVSGGAVSLFNKIRTNDYFQRYALNEYYLLGMYYGMIIIMALYNFLMFLSVKEKSYIFYVLYVLTGGLVSLLEDGTGFEHLWPDYPDINRWIYIFTPFLFLVLFTFYAKTFLEIKRQAPKLNKIIDISLILYFTYLVIDVYISGKPAVFAIFMIPFMIMYFAAIMVFQKGYRPARYFILGYSFVIISFILYLLRTKGLLGPGDPFSVYAFNYGLIFEIVIFSFALSDRVRIIRKEREEAQKKIIEQLQENEKLKDRVTKELESKVQERTKELNKKNKDITDSITYAKRIQEAILPDEDLVRKILKDYFILYLPKAIVSGDFYWVHEKDNKIIFAAVDCTGHGVPGAFMSILGHNFLNQVVKEMNITEPGKILDEVNKKVSETLYNGHGYIKGEYGMDIALATLDKQKMNMQFAGAYNPLCVVRNGEMTEIKADRFSIGSFILNSSKNFNNHSIKLKTGDVVYLFSDGFADQFGGDKRRKFMVERFNELLIEIHGMGMNAQKRRLMQVFEEWKGGHEQLDDILVMGVKI